MKSTHGFILIDSEEPEDKCVDRDCCEKTEWIRDLVHALTEHPGKMLVRTYTDKALQLKHYKSLYYYKRNHKAARLGVHVDDDTIIIKKEGEE